MHKLRANLPELVALVVLAPLVLQIAFVVLPEVGSYSVMSGSMEPVIQTGSLVYVYDTDDYTEGDIITFVEQGETVTHRIVDDTPEGFVTKGETQAVDSWRIQKDQIRGEYLFSLPLYGYLLRPFSSAGLALWGILLGVGILALAGRELFGESNP